MHHSDHEKFVEWGILLALCVIGVIAFFLRKPLGLTADIFGYFLTRIGGGLLALGIFLGVTHIISDYYAMWMGIYGTAGLIGGIRASDEDDYDPSPEPPRPELPTYRPTEDIYGTSRAANRDEVHEALGGKNASPQSQYDYED